MFKMNFILKEKKDRTLTMELPLWFRLLFIFIALMLAAGIYSADKGSSRLWIPGILTIACLAGAVYDERWIFSVPESRVVYISGLFFLHRKKTMNLSEIESFLLAGDFEPDTEGLRASLKKRMVKLSLFMKSGELMDIDISTGRSSSQDLKSKAERLSAYCGVPLETRGN